MSVLYKQGDDDSIRPTRIDVVRRTLNGHFELIENDVGSVAADLRTIDKRLKLRVSKVTGKYVVFYEEENGDQQLVTIADSCDQRLVKRVQEIAQEGYDYGKELDKLDAERKKEIEKEQDEKVSDAGERLAHAIRKDRGVWKDSARSKRSWRKGIVGGNYQ